MSLVVETGAPELFRDIAIPERYGFLDTRGMVMPHERGATRSIVGKSDLSKVDNLIGKINDFNADEHTALLTLLQQFHKARLLLDPVQKAIHLRICIENVFIKHGEKEQLAAKVKNRGASYLCESRTQTERIYDFLSCAVHRGELPQKRKHSPTYIEGRVAGAIKRLLDEGTYPVWSD
ncbi:hypothetical protein Q4539_15035 [Yoonia sp. 1_MG-2023]|nr:hypothetical protein [Yoonia sp. 1_MG-2023]